MPGTMQLTFADGGSIAVEVDDAAPTGGGAGRGNFSAELGVLLAKGSAGASLQVTIVWTKGA